jgi:hypothetical protein
VILPVLVPPGASMVSTLSSEVLPAPEGPMMARVCPLVTTSDACETMVRSPFLMGTVNEMLNWRALFFSTDGETGEYEGSSMAVSWDFPDTVVLWTLLLIQPDQ